MNIGYLVKHRQICVLYNVLYRLTLYSRKEYYEELT